MNPYINRLAGFKGGFIAFFPVEGGGGATEVPFIWVCNRINSQQ